MSGSTGSWNSREVIGLPRRADSCPAGSASITSSTRSSGFSSRASSEERRLRVRRAERGSSSRSSRSFVVERRRRTGRSPSSSESSTAVRRRDERGASSSSRSSITERRRRIGRSLSSSKSSDAARRRRDGRSSSSSKSSDTVRRRRTGRGASSSSATARRRVGRFSSSETLLSAVPVEADASASGKAGASNSGAACSWTCSSRDAPAAPVPRTTRRPPRRRRVGCDASAFGSEAPEACDSVLDTVELSVSSPTKPSRFSVGTMLLAARCIATPSRPVRSSHTMLSPWPRKSFAPRKGNFVSSLSCERRTPALTLSRSREP